MKRKTDSATLSLANVYKRFGDTEAVSDASLIVKSGEVVGFVGPNGAGKTTTIAMLMGFIQPTKGRVELLGELVVPASAHLLHKKIGYVAGDMVLPGALTGAQYLTFCSAQNGRDEEKYSQLVSRLSPMLNQPIKTLSRGNKQKIALIAALQHSPTILILDEPTSGLDPLVQDIFLATIRDEASRGATVFMSSHILSEVSEVCSRIVFMRSGKFILDQKLSNIQKQLGKHIILRLDNPKRLLANLPGDIEVIHQDSISARLVVPRDQLNFFLRWVSTKPVTDITIEDRNLDDVFHELYAPVGRSNRL